MHSIEQALTDLNIRIANAAKRHGREPAQVSMLGVSKKQDVGKIRAAYDAGLLDFGENYLQEASAKQAMLNIPDLRWHFIGPIQSNKTRAIAEGFDWVHSVDRVKIAERLHQYRDRDTALKVCVQINIDAEPSKSGASVEEAKELVDAVVELEHLELRGLMVIPRPQHEFSAQRAGFAKARALFEKLHAGLNHAPSFDTLSMGMSADLEAAIAEGATIVRIGTALFGARPETMGAPKNSG